jgi:hypothetical protein
MAFSMCGEIPTLIRCFKAFAPPGLNFTNNSPGVAGPNNRTGVRAE